MLAKSLRDTLTTQALEEISFARRHKQGRISAWHKNEDQYYAKKVQTDDSRANVNLNEMQSFVQTLLAKIDTPPTIRYTHRDEADLKRAKYANAMLERDSQPEYGNWAMKDLMGKLEGILYGRAVYEYHADSLEGYCSHLDNVTVYDFLIDPLAGGLDIEKAFYLGRAGIIKTANQIKEGVKSGLYLRTEGNALVAGGGTADDKAQEQTNQQNRYEALVSDSRIIQKSDQYKFFEWYTTYEGERYYLLLSEAHGVSIRVEKLKDMFKSGLWPFWTWAVYPDLTEFWSPAPADGVREVYAAKSVAINQMLDNGEAINKPMKAVDVDAITNVGLLKYRKDGIVPFKKGVDLNKAIQFFQTPPITTASIVYEKLTEIADAMSGVGRAEAGKSDDQKVGIYEGNQQNASDRFGLINKSYANGYHRLALLYFYGLMEHLTRKESIEIMGAKGIEYAEVSYRDIKPKKRTFKVSVISSDAEIQTDVVAKRNKLTFLSQYRMAPFVNAKKSFEIEGNIAGLDEDELRQLLDTDNYGNAELMSECARDINSLLAGDDIEPNYKANAAYAQKMLDYIKDHRTDMDEETLERFFSYMESIQEIVVDNTIRMANQVRAEQGMASTSAEGLGMEGGMGEEVPMDGMEEGPLPDSNIVPQAPNQQEYTS